MRPKLSIPLAFLYLALAVPAQAHFLWVVVGDQAPKAQLVLAENPGEETVADLIPKIAAKAWDAAGQSVTFQKQEKTWVADAPAAVAAKQSWGLMDHGGKPFMIEYYAKGGATPEATEVSLKLPYELFARQEGGEVVAWLTQDGMPVAETPVNLHQPGGGKSVELKTDAKGEVRFKPEFGGHYGLRARFIEARGGESAGKAYEEVRHYTTLAFSLPGPPAPAAPAAESHAGGHKGSH